MSDGLTTINAASLTAAVNSLFQKSLPESLPATENDEQGSKNEVKKAASKKRKPRTKSPIKKRKTSTKNQTSMEGQCSEVESAVISIPDHDAPTDHLPSDDLPQTSIQHLTASLPYLTSYGQSGSQQNASVHQGSVTHQQPTSNHQPTIEIPAHISPLTIKQLLSCISPLTVVDGNNEESHLRFSIENRLVGQQDGHSQNDVHSAGFVGLDMHSQLEPAETPGHVQISASLLQNLLQGISNPQQLLPGSSRPANQPAPLPSIHHFTSQPLQTLIQSLFSQDSNPPLHNAREAPALNSSQPFGVRSLASHINSSLPQVSYSMIGSLPQISESVIGSMSHATDASAASVLNQLANFTARENYLNHQSQSNIIQPHMVLQSDNQLLRDALLSIKDSRQNNIYQTLLNQPVQPYTVNSQSSLTDNLPRLDQVFSVSSSEARIQQPSITQLVPSNVGMRIQNQNTTQLVASGAGNKPVLKHLVPAEESSETGIQALGQGFPILLQPAGPNGPLQLIPLDKGVSAQVLREIVNRSVSISDSTLTTTKMSTSGKEPISIQPKPSNQTIENLLQVVNLSNIMLPGVHDNTEEHGSYDEESGQVSDPQQIQTEVEADTMMQSSVEQMEETRFPGDVDNNSDSSSSHEERSPPNTSKFCVDCNRLMKEPCTVHNTDYVYMADTPYLSRARASLPSCFELKKTETSNLQDFLGVWCKGCLSERTKFGPVVGELVTMTTQDFNDQVNGFQPFLVVKGHSSEDGEVKVLRMGDESLCNWTMFLRFAPSLLEQNCTVFKDGDEFYVVTKTEIKEEELLMWFSAEICYQLGISQNPGNVKMNQCEECGLYFLVRRLLHAHLKSKHPENYNFNHACYVCGKKFKSKGKLNSHIATHMFVKPHICHYCQKQFADSSNLKAHVKIHTGLKQYTCEECGKAFRQKAHLNNHVLVHTGSKNFKCEFCDKYFGRRADLKVHTYSHTKEVTFPCDSCDKVFYKLQNMKKHLKVHSGERNYMCDKCFKGFQTKYHRDRHLKICKEKKDSTYMSLEEVAKLEHDDVVPLQKVSEDPEVT